MSEVIKLASRSLRIESLSGRQVDVSVLRDFVRALDEHRIDGRVLVKGFRSDGGHLSQLAVEVTERLDYDLTDLATAEVTR